MKRIEVLDHGYVELIEYWGSEESIIAAARMSTQGAFRGWGKLVCSCGAESETGDWSSIDRCPDERGGAHVSIDGAKSGDEKLLAYLWRNRHSTPFEMAGATFEVQAPIAVFREWHRHRTQSYNEMSARYAPLPDLNYVPTVDRCLVAGGMNKQAGAVAGAAELTPERAEAWRMALALAYETAQNAYELGLTLGVPKEVARMCVPVGRYSKMRASTDLRNWLGFLALRSSAKNPNAQWEIRQFADAVFELLRRRFPRTCALFSERAA